MESVRHTDIICDSIVAFVHSIVRAVKKTMYYIHATKVRQRFFKKQRKEARRGRLYTKISRKQAFTARRRRHVACSCDVVNINNRACHCAIEQCVPSATQKAHVLNIAGVCQTEVLIVESQFQQIKPAHCMESYHYSQYH